MKKKRKLESITHSPFYILIVFFAIIVMTIAIVGGVFICEHLNDKYDGKRIVPCEDVNNNKIIGVECEANYSHPATFWIVISLIIFVPICIWVTAILNSV